jgi:hypothetical protein
MGYATSEVFPAISGRVSMNFDSFYAWCVYGLFIPFLLVGLILVHYVVLRILWRLRKRRGIGRLGFCPSASALALAFQFAQVFHRPSMAYVVEAKQDADEDADEDDNGDGDTPAARMKHFHRQLSRIRRGDPVDRLVLRI